MRHQQEIQISVNESQKHQTKYVERILVIENNVFQNPFVLPLYANGVPTLLFKSVKGKLGNNNCNHLTLFGQTISPDSLTLKENFILIAYFLKPHSLISLFGVSALELTDQPIDLNLLFSQKANSLQEKLLNSESVEKMILLLDKFIYCLMKESKDTPSAIIFAAEMIAGNYLKESLVKIQQELNISERTLQRMFERNIGVSPNMYRRICQFNSAFTDLNLHNYRNLSDIAFNHGYADQSHYIRAFKEFTSINPKQYLDYGKN